MQGSLLQALYILKDIREYGAKANARPAGQPSRHAAAAAFSTSRTRRPRTLARGCGIGRRRDQLTDRLCVGRCDARRAAGVGAAAGPERRVGGGDAPRRRAQHQRAARHGDSAAAGRRRVAACVCCRALKSARGARPPLTCASPPLPPCRAHRALDGPTPLRLVTAPTLPR